MNAANPVEQRCLDRISWARDAARPVEVERLIDEAFSRATDSRVCSTAVVKRLWEPLNLGPAHPWDFDVPDRQPPLVWLSDRDLVDDEFLVSDDAAGAHVEAGEAYVAALRRLLTESDTLGERTALETELTPVLGLLDTWEVDAFRASNGRAATCVRAMAAERMRIMLFDASRRREVGREAAFQVAQGILADVAHVEAEAQATMNALIRDADLAGLRSVTSTRSKLDATVAEIRGFVEQVRHEIAGEATAQSDDDGFNSPAEVAFFQRYTVIDGPAPSAEPPTAATPPWGKRAKTDPKGKRARGRTTDAGRVSSGQLRKVIALASTILVFATMVIYFTFEKAIEGRYKKRAPDFAEFDASRLSGVLPVASAVKIRDAADVVVEKDWPALSRERKVEKVTALFAVLRPSGVSQLYLFDGDRRMVASYRNGVVTVIN